MRLKFMTLIWMTWRNLSARKLRAGLSFMTWVSIVGIAIGVAALIVVLSVMGGFEQDLRNKMLAGQPHYEIVSKVAAAGFSLRDNPISQWQKIFPEADTVEPFVQSDVVLKNGKHLAGVSLFGIDPKQGGITWGFGKAMSEGTDLQAVDELHQPNFVDRGGRNDRWPGIVLGEDLALTLAARPGDLIVALSPQGATSSNAALSGSTLARSYVVTSTFRTGLFQYDAKWAVVSLPEGRKFLADYDPSLDREEFVSGVAMNLTDPYLVSTFDKRLKPYAQLEGLSWLTVNKSLLFALKLEKLTMGTILMLIVVVAAFSISGTMMMTVYHKRQQVSILRSLGMTRQQIAHLYLMHGLSIGLVGVAAGAALGIGMCMLIRTFKFIDLPNGVYYLKTLPVKFLPGNYLIIVVLALVFSVVAAIYPAFTAARQDPSRGLRYT